MARPRTEAERLASELCSLPIPRAELIVRVSKLIADHMDEQAAWLRRIELAEWEAKDALGYAKSCEKAAIEYHDRLQARRADTIAICAEAVKAYGKHVATIEGPEGVYKSKAAQEIADALVFLFGEQKPAPEVS